MRSALDHVFVSYRNDLRKSDNRFAPELTTLSTIEPKSD